MKSRFYPIFSPVAVFFTTPILFSWILLGCASNQNVRPLNTKTTGNHSRADHRQNSTSTKDMKGMKSHAANQAQNETIKKMRKWDVTADKVKKIKSLVEKAAKENNIPEDLILGVIWVESRFNPEAISPVGAQGLMQLMPKTADYLAECIGWKGRHDSSDPEFNIAAGSYYVARLIKQFEGDRELALAAYNAGPGNIRKWMKNTGLPNVSIEYHTMVQTARQFFGYRGEQPSMPNIQPSAPAVIPTDDDLDKLGLAILIAGLSSKQIGLDRTDASNPFETN